MFNFLEEVIVYVVSTLIHNAPSLALGILVASMLKVYIHPDKFKQVLMRQANVSILSSVGFGAFTPFCACGTMAVIVSMLTTALPWGPIMAFLTSSPLMSPDHFIMISGIVNMNFAIALAISSVIIGIGSGYMTHYIEKNTNFLNNQARFAQEPVGSACGCSEAAISKDTPACHCDDDALSCCSKKQTFSAQNIIEKYKLKELFEVFYQVGVKKVLVNFTIFVAIGYMINKFVPAALITRYLGKGNILAVPILALIGLPLYVSGSSSIPIINALMAGGASNGSLLAFMITGPGTSAGVIAGITTIIKRRALALYIAYLLFGAILLGYFYDFILILIK